MQNRKKILHVITGLEVGGAETNLAKVVPALEKDFENHICCLTGEGKKIVVEKFEKADIPIHRLHIQSIFDFINPSKILAFRKIIKEFKPDVLETYLIHADLFGRIWGKLFGVKKVICNHRGSLLQWEWLSPFDRLTSFLVDKYVFQTPSAQKEISKKIKVNLEKTTVIPNTIDLNAFKFELDRSKKLEELEVKNKENLNIVFVSNLREGKGCKYLIEAFEKIFLQGHKNVNLIIGGDGDQKKPLQKQISECKSKENIRFLGNRRNDTFEIFRIGDIFVLPTFYEGMSNIIMEAMASKLPIITTNIDVNKDLIEDGKTGILIPPGDSDAIAKNLIRLLNNPEERQNLGQAAHEEIKKNYSIEVVSKKVSDLLKSVTQYTFQ